MKAKAPTSLETAPIIKGRPLVAPFVFRGGIMDNDGNNLPLVVTIPADEWTGITRELAYSRTIILQLLDGQDRVKEWFTAAELLALCLPGLPQSRQRLANMAKRQHWRAQWAGSPPVISYHYSSLPETAFNALLSRATAWVQQQKYNQTTRTQSPLPTPAKTQKAITAPPWVLPLMRLVRSERHTTLRQAVSDIQARGISCPPLTEIRATLERLGVKGLF